MKKRATRDADTIDQAVNEPVRSVRGMARLIRALRAEHYPLDHSGIDYSVGDVEIEDGSGAYVPVRDLTTYLVQETYEDSEALISDLQNIARGAKVIEMPARNKSLADRDCVPCRKGTPPLDSRQAHDYLVELGHGWSFTDEGHLHKIFRFKDFAEPMSFANRIAKIAEKENHHPDLHVSWGKVMVELWTHSINGLSEADFVLAAKVEKAS